MPGRGKGYPSGRCCRWGLLKTYPVVRGGPAAIRLCGVLGDAIFIVTAEAIG